MQNNLKSVMFFRKVFKVFFSAYFFALFCSIPAGKSQILYAELCLSLSGLTCGRYCRPETPVLFKVIFLHIFFAVTCLCLHGIPAGCRQIRYYKSCSPLPDVYFFCCFFCRPAFYACGIFSPAILIC